MIYDIWYIGKCSYFSADFIDFRTRHRLHRVPWGSVQTPPPPAVGSPLLYHALHSWTRQSGTWQSFFYKYYLKIIITGKFLRSVPYFPRTELFVGIRPTREFFHLCGEFTIAVEGLHIFMYAQLARILSSRGSLSGLMWHVRGIRFTGLRTILVAEPLIAQLSLLKDWKNEWVFLFHLHADKL